MTLRVIAIIQDTKIGNPKKIKKSPRRQRRKKSILKKKMTSSKNLSESEGEIEKTPSSKRYYAF